MGFNLCPLRFVRAFELFWLSCLLIVGGGSKQNCQNKTWNGHKPIHVKWNVLSHFQKWDEYHLEAVPLSTQNSILVLQEALNNRLNVRKNRWQLAFCPNWGALT